MKHFLPFFGHTGRVRIHPLKGDGSDRRWFRVHCGPRSFILAHHPRGRTGRPSENDSFYRIGTHLLSKGFPVPVIYGYRPRGGQFLLEDWGDLSLEAFAGKESERTVRKTYEKLVVLLARLQVEAAAGFDPQWCYDTPLYNGAFAHERETLYFIRAFCQGMLGREPHPAVREELTEIAGRVDQEPLRLFLYRDFQSRNIMIHSGGFGLIDFQGGRLGPPQYDLASLLIDPYVQLPWSRQEALLDVYFQALRNRLPGPRPTKGEGGCITGWESFREHYRLIGFQRNLQILGAFAYLTRVKGKTHFSRSIPPAIRNLKRWVRDPVFRPYRAMRKLVAEF